MKKILYVLLCLIFTLSATASVFADSGSSTLPKLTPRQEYCYKYIAPASQTSFKPFYKTSDAVEDLKVERKQIKAICTRAGMASGIISAAPISIAQVVGKVIAGASGTVYCIADKEYNTLAKAKKDVLVETKVSFRWTDAEKLKYQIKIETYFTHKGKRVGNIKTTYQSGDAN